MELNFKIIDKSDKSLKIREANLSTFKKKGFPNKREEDWKFTDLEKVLNENFKELNNVQLDNKKPNLKDLKFSHNSITLVNGKLESFDFKSENLKDKNCLKNDYFNIAVHIRRPNPDDNRIMGVDTPDKYYLDNMNNLRQKYKDKKIMFLIYSQGELSNFSKYIANDTILKINMNIFDTFTEMVGADALIMSRSSFSYSAAVLSDGDIYYQQFWHPPMKHWYL